MDLRAIPASSRVPTLHAHEGLTVRRFTCIAGPKDPVFEEAHDHACVSWVLSGAYRYRSSSGSATLVPGSLLFGRACECYECAHADGEGDDNIVVAFTFDWLEAAGLPEAPWSNRHSGKASAPPSASLTRFAALGSELGWGVMAADAVSEFAVEFVGKATNLLTEDRHDQPANIESAIRRVTEVVRWIESDPGADCSLAVLAERAGKLVPFLPALLSSHRIHADAVQTSEASHPRSRASEGLVRAGDPGRD